MLVLKNAEKSIAYEELLFLDENEKLKLKTMKQRQAHHNELRSLFLVSSSWSK